MPRHRFLCGFAFAVLSGVLVGCGNSGSGDSAASGPKGLFDAQCSKCHAQAGQPGGPGVGSSKGPNLSKIGAEPGRTADYIADYIRDPKSKKADAKMPAFGSRLKDDEIRSLAEYLAGMK